MCSKDEKCVCKANYFQLNETTCSPLLGEFCRKNESCAPDNSHCVENECKCSDNYEQISNQRCRLKVVESRIVPIIGMACIHDEDCNEIIYAKCSEEKDCVCRVNNVQINETTCAPLLGEFCWKDGPCAPDNSHCVKSECKCNDNYEQISNQLCRLKVVESRIATIIGMACIQDEDCNKIRYAKCSEEKDCVCRANNGQINETTCAPFLGGFCLKNELCATDNSHCIDNECKCKDNYLKQFDNFCMPSALGLSCSDDAGCGKVYDIKCFNATVCRSLLNGFCLIDNDCLPHNSFCIHNKCVCKLHFQPTSNTQCVPPPVGLDCKQDTDCNSTKNVVCSDEKKCGCSSGYHLMDALCFPTINESCQNNEPCAHDNSLCIDNICQCKPNYVYRKFKCIPSKLTCTTVELHYLGTSLNWKYLYVFRTQILL
ncbi:prion-like-(Q/N-rich) domain-bearing protein 25 [Microplitis mediator]|uniref:prion-like-(Q/N-rich) domain-bearing protein 25 n=1 Tax=Microplitis mediator TaxID=375433 RepID=UPI0025557AB7|nr:prion-like-(Q/N-rich) domain-bearing protein 25 [Microplitis mediator]